MNLRPVCLSLVVGAFAILGCSGPTYLHGKALEQNEYRGYGEYLPERDREVLAQAAAVKDAAAVIFLQETLPEGIEMTSHMLQVKDGYSHQLLGKLAFSRGRVDSKQDLIAHVRKVAQAAGGDAAVGLFLLTPADDYTQAQAVEAVILKLDPRVRAKLRPDEATVKGSSAAPGIELL
ncbi:MULTISPECIES: hypothetical protein [Corallococcus]|uniref:hypothetical protein n=1 Tax=Corallococcus TaxID=83461 RepID=UPI0011C3B1B3|nr:MULTISPECIES: hypothetical protein [Corallococcus]NPD24072.1 hypothetical protein [Corallococcus exiguus]NRD48044.1 hypothetical protein [Corallococcus exiguus]